jgi:hypothetical protein
VFCSSLDKLLLDTRHVYIRKDHKSDGFYLPEFGPVFTAHISITAGASLPQIVEEWSQWFQAEEGKIIINTKNKDAEEIKKQAEEKKKKYKEHEEKYKKDDLERLEKMQKSIELFKSEVMELILDFGPILQGTNSRDTLSIVFHVADDAFFEEYHTRTLLVQIPMDKVKNLSGASVDDSEVQKAFQWNI